MFGKSLGLLARKTQFSIETVFKFLKLVRVTNVIFYYTVGRKQKWAFS